MSWSPLQRRALEAMGYGLVQAHTAPPKAGAALSRHALPPTIRSSLERWVGALWIDWPAPEGRPGDAAFKRALWRRIRDWRRGG